VRRLWPPALRARSIDSFPEQQAIGDTLAGDRLRRLATLRMLLARSSRTLPLWVMGSTPELYSIARAAAARGVDEADLVYTLGLGAIAERDYRLAAERLATAEARDPKLPDVRYYRILASTLAGDRVTAKAMLLEARGRAQQNHEDLKLWDWAEKDLGLQENPA
jgi:hypothetical protein